MNDKIGIYIHIPFCVKKCAYCDFCSFPSLSHAEEYAEAVTAHIKKYRDVRADTLYIGGGTPTYIPPQLLTGIISTAVSAFGLDDGSEISVECNPGTADREYFEKLRECGVNRISIGMQSAVADELSALGRIHDISQTEKAVSDAKKAGIDNINLDLMYGIPYQTVSSFEHSLNRALSFEPTHISAYALKIEEGTELHTHASELELPDEDSVCDMLGIACNMLSDAGMKRYEISNFSSPGFECKHNIKYWKCKPYLSFGPSASSYFDGKRYTYNRSLSDYISYVNGKKEFSQILSECSDILKDEQEYEYIMLGLRLTDGISDREFKECYGYTFSEKYGEKFEKYIRLGLAETDGKIYKLNGNGLLVSNAILSELI